MNRPVPRHRNPSTLDGRCRSGATSSLLFLVLGLALAACSGCGEATRHRSTPVVTVSCVKAGSMPRTITFTGALRAERRGSVSAGLAGVVVRVAVREGDRVSAGQPVIWLDAREAESQRVQQEAAVSAARARVQELGHNVSLTERQGRGNVEQAREGLRQAHIAVSVARTTLLASQRDVQRYQTLYQKKAVPLAQVEKARLQDQINEDQLRTAQSRLIAAESALRMAESNGAQVHSKESEQEAARASLRQAEAALQSTEVALARHVLRAPVAGVVVERNVQPGMSVAPGTGLLTLVDNSRLEFFSPVDHEYAPLLKPGLRAVILAVPYPGVAFPARVVDVIPSNDPRTSTRRVRLSVGDSRGRLVDGSSVEVRIVTSARSGVLVPVEAVRTRDGVHQVRVVRDQVISTRTIDAVERNDVSWLATRGVSAGDWVVDEGADDVPDHEKVQVQVRTARVAPSARVGSPPGASEGEGSRRD